MCEVEKQKFSPYMMFSESFPHRSPAFSDKLAHTASRIFKSSEADLTMPVPQSRSRTSTPLYRIQPALNKMQRYSGMRVTARRFIAD